MGFENMIRTMNLPQTSASLLCLMMAAGSVNANAVERVETEESLDVETIIVTGTRRKDRTMSESTVPIDIISADDLQKSGMTETNQLLAALLPSFNFPEPSITDGTDHVKPAVLRGLAPDHVLVLVNGKRRHSSALLNVNGSVGRGSSAVDMNMIPSAAIKRIEVLRDGAAAQYGSDAIAGVINIVLKNSDEGGSLVASYGQYNTTMDGVPDLKNVSIDSNGDLEFEEGGDRKANDGSTLTLSGSLGTELGEGGFLHLSGELRSKDITDRSGYDTREQYNRIDGNLDPRELTFDRFNHNFGSAEVEEYNLFFNANMPIGEELNAYAFGSYGHRDGSNSGFYRRARDSRNVSSIYPDGFLPFIDSTIDDMSLIGGFTGVYNDWDWDASVGFGQDKFSYGVSNSLNASQGADSQTEFDAGALIYNQVTFNFDASRVYEPSFLPDMLIVSFGTEYRREGYEIEAGEEASYITVFDEEGNPVAAGGAQVFPGFKPSNEVDKSRNNIGFYIELDTDLTENWNMAIAGRMEEYSDFGNAINAKVATRYVINDRVSVRGAASSGFRAPSLAQSSFTSTSTFFSSGVPYEAGLYPVDDPVALALGAVDLEAEKSLNFSLGLAVEVIEGLNVTIDAYKVKIDDRIILSEMLSGEAVDEILADNGIRGVDRVRYFTNAIDSEVEGVDVVGTYDLALGDAGNVELSVAYNHNESTVTHVDPNPDVLEELGDDYVLFGTVEVGRFEKGTPLDKWNLSASWVNGDWGVNVRGTRYGEVTDVSSNEDFHEVLSPAWIVDFDASYNITEKLRFSLGANNVFDQYPEDTVSNVRYTTFNKIMPYSGFSAYGKSGRYLYARIAYSF